MTRQSLIAAMSALACLIIAAVASAQTVPLHRVFETQITNDKLYDNKFRDVTLNATFKSPSGRTTRFWGFFDGDGKGGGSATRGNVWKLRFLPDEPGTWAYRYSWSDGTPGGKGEFEVEKKGAGKGVLRPYAENPRWLAYNGVTPAYIKSYYVGAAFNHSLEWYAKHVYQPLIDRGYDHVMVNNGMPLAWMGPGDIPGNTWTDYDGEVLDKLIYDKLDPYRQNLKVWRQLEAHLRWLNARDVGVHLFEGLTANGKRRAWRERTVFANLSAEEQAFWIRYTCARIAPFANIAGWKYTWEKGFDEHARRMFDLLEQYDPWDHLRDIHTTGPRGAPDDRRVTWSGLSAGWVKTSTDAHGQALEVFEAAGKDNPPFMEEVITTPAPPISSCGQGIGWQGRTIRWRPSVRKTTFARQASRL